MTLEEFLQQSEGDWLSQRTNHDVADSRYASGRCTIAVEVLSASSFELATICQQHDIEPASTAGGLKYVWTGRLDGDKGDRTETTISVFIPDGGIAATGKLVRTSHSVGQFHTSTGQYSLGSDDALTMNASSDSGAFKERTWFASENLRIRSTIVETADGFSAASLSSDIRKLSPKPAA
ncbi:MAG: phycobiliprotein lyase [Synechococcus sp.]